MGERLVSVSIGNLCIHVQLVLLYIQFPTKEQLSPTHSNFNMAAIQCKMESNYMMLYKMITEIGT